MMPEYGALGDGSSNGKGARTSISRTMTFSVLTFVAAILAAAMVASGQERVNREVSLLDVISPGTRLELQTSSGPMALTVDSAMNAAGYVHAHGVKNGVTYAGFVKLTASNAAATQSQLASPDAEQLSTLPALQQPMISDYPQQQMQQQVEGRGMEGTQTLDISRNGAVTINGESVVAANGRTAAILRLLAKRVEHAQRVPQQSLSLRIGGEQLAHELDRTSGLLSRLEKHRRSEKTDSEGGRQAMWAAMQTLMRTVNKIERKEDRMDKTVDRVRKIMRY